MVELTVDRLRERLDYDPESGDFNYLHDTRGHRAGATVGTVLNNGYVQIWIDGKKYLAHRIAWFMVHGEMPGVIDHINGIRDDNRITNLRLSTCRKNQQNRIEHRELKRLVGAHYAKAMRTHPWRGIIRVAGKNVHLGYFATEREAHDEYIRACERVEYGVI